MKKRQPKASKDTVQEHWTKAQVHRIRTALITYVETVKFFDGKGMNWVGLSEAIDEVTGTRIPVERLRQFACGSPRIIGKDADGRPIRYRKMSTLLPERMQAVVRYLTDKHVGALTIEDLRTPDFPASLANGLHAYLHDQSPEVGEPPQKLDGHFVARCASDVGIKEEEVRIEMTIETVAPKGVFRIEESSTVLQVLDGVEIPLSERLYEGWAVLTPTDQALFFTQDIADGFKHIWVLGGEVDFWSLRAVNRIVLHRERYPSELDVTLPNAEIIDALSKQVTHKITIFERNDG